jgi:cell division protein ZapE
LSPAQALSRDYERAVRQRTLSEDPAQRVVLARLGQLADCLQSSPVAGPLRRWLARRWPRSFALQDCKGIYLWGSVGRGKTWLVDLFGATLPAAAVRRMHFQHLMREVHRQLGNARHLESPLRQVAASLARARVLCIDEFNVHDIGDAMLLHGLVEALLAQGVVLVCTSNTPPHRLYEGGLQRARFLPAIRLLEQRLDVVQIGAGPDYRLRELEGASTWFASQDPATPQLMQRLFLALSGAAPGAAASGGTLQLEGREVPLRHSAHGMAWFEFAALCEGPRSANDYIALADEMHTVFLSGIPVFTESGDDAARRFIGLVDELYDRGVKLVASAAAEPAQLYQGVSLQAAFLRTASRLAEMRSHAYLARSHQAGGVTRGQA